MQNIDKLSAWIQPQHLAAAAIEKLKNLSSSEFEKGFFLDDFFKPEIVARLQHAVTQVAQYHYLYAISSRNHYVKEEEFFGAPEQERCRYTRRYLTGVKAQYRISPNWLTYLKFLDFYQKSLVCYLEEISGYAVCEETHRTVSHQKEHFPRKHTDFAPGRRFCIILYLAPDWTAECGGALHMCRQNEPEKIIEAQYNRLVIFSPNLKSEHYVASHSEFAKDKTRDCHIAWFKDK